MGAGWVATAGHRAQTVGTPLMDPNDFFIPVLCG
jgi:hypothetical protein